MEHYKPPLGTRSGRGCWEDTGAAPETGAGVQVARGAAGGADVGAEAGDRAGKEKAGGGGVSGVCGGGSTVVPNGGCAAKKWVRSRALAANAC